MSDHPQALKVTESFQSADSKQNQSDLEIGNQETQNSGIDAEPMTPEKGDSSGIRMVGQSIPFELYNDKDEQSAVKIQTGRFAQCEELVTSTGKPMVSKLPKNMIPCSQNGCTKEGEYVCQVSVWNQ